LRAFSIQKRVPPTNQSTVLATVNELLPQYKIIERQFASPTLCQVVEIGDAKFPVLVRKSDSVLTKFWWSETPFEKNTRLLLPIRDLTPVTPPGPNRMVELEPLLFNQPIRRDIVHRVLQWSLMYNKRTTHRTRVASEVAGSGAKPRPQKGMGKARLGNKRASGRRGGGKVFGHIPKDFTFIIPHKIKVRGLVSCLSAKLAEGKVRVYESERLPDHKTKNLAKLFEKIGHKETKLFVVPKITDRNFMLASQNIEYLKVVRANELSVRDLLKFDKVVFTQQSLHEVTQLVLAWLFHLEKPKAVKNEAIESLLNLNFSKEQPDRVTPIYDPESNWEPRFEILRDYYQQYKQQKTKGKEEEEGAKGKDET
jgi:large subunit ribosomal protein L4